MVTAAIEPASIELEQHISGSRAEQNTVAAARIDTGRTAAAQRGSRHRLARERIGEVGQLARPDLAREARRAVALGADGCRYCRGPPCLKHSAGIRYRERPL